MTPIRTRYLALFALVVAAAFAAPAAAQPSLAQKAGQMLMLGFQGDSPDAAGVQAVTSDIAAGRVGGVLYLGHNVASLDAVRAMNGEFAAASAGAPLALPALIAIDQEGGSIERLKEAIGFTEIPSAETVALTLSADEAEGLYADLAGRLRENGFNVNFGPVVDLNTNPDNPIIARWGRSFGEDAGRVVEYAKAFVDAHRATHVLTALKHFPGHGSSRDDSHEGFVDITDTWDEDELLPYRELIEFGMVDMIMSGHLYNADYAGEGGEALPASLSPAWITGELRGSLGYEGVVITDDLEMAAVREHFSLKDRVVAAVRAGNDILLFSNTAAYSASLAQDIIRILVDEAERDPAFAALIHASYQRIAELKSRL